jgi:hypothetical protein
MSGDGHDGAVHAHVQKAAKLLQMRGSGDVYRQVAVERKLKAMPAHVVEKARAHLDSGGGSGPQAEPGSVTLADDSAIVEKKLGFNGLELLPVGGMPTSGDMVYSDERVLFRVTVINVGNLGASKVHVHLSVSGQRQATLVIPDVAPDGGEAVTEWASKEPYSVGKHTARVEFDHDPKSAYEIPFIVRMKAAGGHHDYGELLQTAISRCNEHVTKDFLTEVEEKCQQFAKAAHEAVEKLDGESNEKVEPLFDALAGMLKKTVELGIEAVEVSSGVGVIVAGLQEFATTSAKQAVAAAANSHARFEKEAKKRLDTLADEMVSNAKDAFMAGWKKWNDTKLGDALELAIAAEDQVPPDPANIKEFSAYIDSLIRKIGLPNAENFDTTPLYDEFRRMHWHVLQHLHGADVLEPGL